MTPYEVLGLAPGASLDEARAAYRRLTRELHPDTRSSSLDPAVADEALRQVRAAWEQVASGAGAGFEDDGAGAGWGRAPAGRRFPWWVVALAVLLAIFVVTAYAGSVPVTTR